MITQNYLKSLLWYDPKTSMFIWIVARKNIKLGQFAGSLGLNGYITISIDGKAYYAHRLAFLYITGVFPEYDIDHKDTNRSNNKWENLRASSRSQNMMNGTRRSDNTSGFKGVSFDKRVGKWRSRLVLNKKEFHLGTFETKELAHEAYIKAAETKFRDFSRPHG